MVINNPIVTDSEWLQAAAVAIQNKDGGSKMGVPDFASRIEAIPTGGSVEKKDVNFYDWEGTLLFGYSVEEVQAMTSLPAPDTSSNYQSVDHDLLTFQKWTRNLTNIKTWVQNHEGGCLDVGAIYTTADGQNHNYWGNPRLNTLTTINMQKRGTTSIGSNAFANCYSLTQINIPDSVTSIEESAFQNCYSLAQISIPDSVTSIGSGAFQNCYSLAQISIPDSVTSIGSSAFYYDYSLTQINIPDSVTSIELGAFARCYSLTQINIPDSVTSIGRSAFFYDYSLTQINIPDSVTSIKESAFQGCVSLCDILLESKSTLANTNAFSGLPAIYRLYVPRANLSWFETETNWSTIYTQSHIVAIEDCINYLESIGFNVDKYKGGSI